jgi:hypothetical protein
MAPRPAMPLLLPPPPERDLVDARRACRRPPVRVRLRRVVRFQEVAQPLLELLHAGEVAPPQEAPRRGAEEQLHLVQPPQGDNPPEDDVFVVRIHAACGLEVISRLVSQGAGEPGASATGAGHVRAARLAQRSTNLESARAFSLGRASHPAPLVPTNPALPHAPPRVIQPAPEPPGPTPR